MGRIEKKFQKKKDRERAVRKKILAKRTASREFMKDEKKKEALERATKKGIPIRKHSPELQKVLKDLQKFDLDSTDTPAETSDVPVVGWAPPSAEATLAPR